MTMTSIGFGMPGMGEKGCHLGDYRDHHCRGDGLVQGAMEDAASTEPTASESATSTGAAARGTTATPGPAIAWWLVGIGTGR